MREKALQNEKFEEARKLRDMRKAGKRNDN